jgi:hypothetical protein
VAEKNPFAQMSLEIKRAIDQDLPIIFDNCWLGGSPAIRHDAVLFIEATKQLGVMLNSCRSALKNL